MSTSEPGDLHTPRLQTWRGNLRRKYGDRVEVVITRNRRSMAAIRRYPDGRAALRVQYGFEHAPQEVLDALEAAAFAGSGRKPAWEKVCAFAKTLPDQGNELTRRAPPKVQPVGRHFDLGALLEEVNRTYFDGRLEAQITWGSRRARTRSRARKRTLQFGLWDAGLKLIRIHPDLDRPDVPAEFLRYIIYHELCHAVHPPKRAPNGSMRIHHPEFKALESRFPDHDNMEQIGKKLFERLTGRPAQ